MDHFLVPHTAAQWKKISICQVTQHYESFISTTYYGVFTSHIHADTGSVHCIINTPLDAPQSTLRGILPNEYVGNTKSLFPVAGSCLRIRTGTGRRSRARCRWSWRCHCSRPPTRWVHSLLSQTGVFLAHLSVSSFCISLSLFLTRNYLCLNLPVSDSQLPLYFSLSLPESLSSSVLWLVLPLYLAVSLFVSLSGLYLSLSLYSLNSCFSGPVSVIRFNGEGLPN